MSDFETAIEIWSASGDRDVLRELEPLVDEAHADGKFRVVECWRGDSSFGYARALKPGDVLAYGGCASWSTREHEARMFSELAADEHGGEKVVYHVKSAEMLDISEYSMMKSEGEVLSRAAAQFEVVSSEYDECDGYAVELRQLS